ncbi:MAG: hypothetical protein GXO02_01430 [Epsilonproteobacteria bacterium]|nr:hypothetical protein [Campylobacterota bacterium]
MRYFILLFMLILALFGNNLVVTSDNFEYEESKNRAIFVGNAYAKRGESEIWANKLIVFLDENNETKEYQAIGNVRFIIRDNEQNIKGKCDFLRYFPQEDRYYLKGRVYVNDILKKREMWGDDLYIDNKRRYVKARSLKKGKSVKFIFKMKDKNQNSKDKKGKNAKKEKK